jgi:hypothetical protein
VSKTSGEHSPVDLPPSPLTRLRDLRPATTLRSPGRDSDSTGVSGNGESGVGSELERLSALHAQGRITDAEYAIGKQRVLGPRPAPPGKRATARPLWTYLVFAGVLFAVITGGLIGVSMLLADDSENQRGDLEEWIVEIQPAYDRLGQLNQQMAASAGLGPICAVHASVPAVVQQLRDLPAPPLSELDEPWAGFVNAADGRAQAIAASCTSGRNEQVQTATERWNAAVTRFEDALAAASGRLGV